MTPFWDSIGVAVLVLAVGLVFAVWAWRKELRRTSLAGVPFVQGDSFEQNYPVTQFTETATQTEIEGPSPDVFLVEAFFGRSPRWWTIRVVFVAAAAVLVQHVYGCLTVETDLARIKRLLATHQQVSAELYRLANDRVVWWSQHPPPPTGGCR